MEKIPRSETVMRMPAHVIGRADRDGAWGMVHRPGWRLRVPGTREIPAGP